MNKISITYTSPEFKEAAIKFARQHNYVCTTPDKISSSLVLNFTPEFTELRDTEKDIEVHIDFTSGNLAHRQQFGGGRGQTIAKAIGLKQGIPPPTVIDATAGLAKDAFVLACLGCPVTLIERSPIIVELINNAIMRAQQSESFIKILEKGFKVIQASSIDYLSKLPQAKDAVLPEVIYMDPMYPERKKSASVKKNMQLLQQLLGQDTDTNELLETALNTALKRVVVKRPKGAAPLSNMSPTYEVSSKNTRYDVYIIQR